MTVGTPEVIELLETYLELAKNQRWGSVAIALTGHPGVAAADFAGDISLEMATLEALGLLHGRLAANIACWKRPPQDPGLDASYVCYPVANGPLGFDFLVWLIDAEMTRVRAHASGPLRVGFWLGKDAERRMHSDRRRMWLENVFRPLLPMIGAIEDERAIYGHCKEVYVPRDIVAAARCGEKVPRLRPRLPAKYHGLVTITLREAEHGTTRNSNLGAWQAFVKLHCPDAFFIRDTANADEPMPGFNVDPRASRDLDYRMSIYEGASVNLFVSNGPSGLAVFGSRPYLIFMQPSGDEDWSTPEAFVGGHGIKFGEQWPWSRSDQRIVWALDTYENIVNAWTQLKQASAA